MNLCLRKAAIEDMDLLFRWANDAAVRRNAFHTEQISYEDHVKWFGRIMADASVQLYILCDGEAPVGQIRLNIEDTAAFIDYSVCAESRGKGCGSRMLGMIQERVQEMIGITQLIGQVKYENTASARVFEKCGYRKREMPEYIQYELDLDRMEDKNEDYYRNDKIMEY